MDSDSDSYFEESSSEAEEEVAGPLHVKLEINLEGVTTVTATGFFFAYATSTSDSCW